MKESTGSKSGGQLLHMGGDGYNFMVKAPKMNTSDDYELATPAAMDILNTNGPYHKRKE